MDWKIFSATFITIFLAELGDKTQLANFSLSAKSGSWVSVFLASVTAFALVTIITVFIGSTIGKIIKPEYIRYSTSIIFIVIGFLMLIGKI
ncbi:MAG: TMEM165/GDT1 family protein [Endomicrobiales bacterium]|nr:TMEM165/GDT1 family protein [Endomicrobiales bacterium]